MYFPSKSKRKHYSNDAFTYKSEKKSWKYEEDIDYLEEPKVPVFGHNTDFIRDLSYLRNLKYYLHGKTFLYYVANQRRFYCKL
jgi:hypothetical protein